MADAAGPNNVTLQRLEEQARWYGDKSRDARRKFKSIKVVEILAAAIIPFLGSLSVVFESLKNRVTLVSGALGVLITILEGVLHLNQYQQNWTGYRSTAEALKHEKYLYLAHAGIYSNEQTATAQLAERVESMVSQEHAQWTSIQQQSAKGPAANP